MSNLTLSNLTVRGLDANTKRWLRARAAEHSTSLNRELLDILRTAMADELAAKSASPLAAVYLKAKALGVRTTSSTAEIRRMRDTR